MPTRTQLASENAHLRARCREAEASRDRLLADSSGAAEVAFLRGRVDALESEAA